MILGYFSEIYGKISYRNVQVAMNKHTMPRRNRLKALLEKLKAQSEWSASKLAEKIGVSKQTFSNWTNCRVDPDVRHLEAIARVANLSLNSLVAYLDNKPMPLEKRGMESLLEEVRDLSVQDKIQVVQAILPEIQSWINLVANQPEVMMNNQNAPNDLVQMVYARLQILGEEEFFKICRITKPELDSFLQGKKPNLAVLAIVDKVLPDIELPDLCNLASNVYGENTPAAMPPVEFLAPPESPENKTEKTEDNTSENK